MNFTHIMNDALKYYNIIDKDDFIETGSIKIGNSTFIDLFINEVNFTAESFGLDDRLERGFNVHEFGSFVVISPFKKRRE